MLKKFLKEILNKFPIALPKKFSKKLPKEILTELTICSLKELIFKFSKEVSKIIEENPKAIPREILNEYAKIISERNI